MMENLCDKHRLIAERLKQINKNIAQAAYDAGRKASDIKLLAATKTVAAEDINFALSNGLKLIGENKVQELLSKYEQIDNLNCDVHFIGHLQSNKVKYIVDKVSLIHSVDSIKLALEISKQAKKINKNMDILLQVNIANEISKSGFAPAELNDAVYEISELDCVKIKGFMCIPPPGKKENENLCYFQAMQKLAIDIKDKNIDNIDVRLLSMGMSLDYRDAIACGSNIVRIGSGIFGSRVYPQ